MREALRPRNQNTTAMKKLFGLMAAMLVLSGPVAAQSTPERVAALINAQDSYALERLAPAVRDSLPPVLAHLTTALTGSRFNRLPESCRAIETLLGEHMAELDGPTASWLFSMLLGNLRLLNAYEQALPVVDMLTATIPPTDSLSHTTLAGMRRMFGALAAVPPTRLARPAGDVTLPLYVETEHIRNALGEPTDIRTLYTDVTLGEKTERFIFDTGCSHGSFVSEAFARRHGIRMLCDSILVSGAGASGYAALGTLDSMRIGPITMYNPVFIISPPNEAVDTLYRVEAVLGTDFMALAERVELYPHQGRIVLPAEPAPMPASGRNLSLDTGTGQYILRVACDGEPVTMIFDTGSVASCMTGRWFSRHEAQVQATGRRKEFGVGGFGGVRRGWGYELPALTFALCLPADHAEATETNLASRCTLQNIAVHSDMQSPLDGACDGWLGSDFVLGFDCVAIDFDRMFITVGKEPEE